MNRKHVITLFLSLAAAAVVGSITAVAAAIFLAILDMYLSSHGLPTLSRAWIDRGTIHLSQADVILVPLATVAGLAAGVAVWWARSVRAR